MAGTRHFTWFMTEQQWVYLGHGGTSGALPMSWRNTYGTLGHGRAHGTLPWPWRVWLSFAALGHLEVHLGQSGTHGTEPVRTPRTISRPWRSTCSYLRHHEVLTGDIQEWFTLHLKTTPFVALTLWFQKLISRNPYKIHLIDKGFINMWEMARLLSIRFTYLTSGRHDSRSGKRQNSQLCTAKLFSAS